MGNGKSFYGEENIEQGIDKVISELDKFIKCKGGYIGCACKKYIYSPMQEILNEFIKIDNSNNVEILQEFEDIGSLEEIKKECSSSKDINDYVDIFKDIVENSEKINEIKYFITKYDECLKYIENLKDIKLSEDSTENINKNFETIDKYFKTIDSLGQDGEELVKKMANYKSGLKQYNEIINLKSSKGYGEDFIDDRYSKDRSKKDDIETIKKFREYCNEITKNSKFDKLSIESKLREIRKSLWDDVLSDRCSRVENNIIDQLYDIKIEQKYNTGKKDDDGKDIPHEDLTYKYRKIIRNWISCFNKLLASKEDPSDGSRYEKWATLSSYLQALDDNLTYYQNQNKARTKFSPGFYTAKSKIPYTEDDKGNKVLYKEDKQENIIKNEDKKEIKEKIIKSKIEKKMWNVKQQKPYFSVNDVKQGSGGDCWLEATLKSMALKSPKKLLDLFPNHLKEVSPIYGTLLGNQITIKLYDYSEKQKNDVTTFIPGKIKEMTVDATEINWNRGKAFWPSIIEKAIDKLIEKFHYNESKDYGRQISGNFGAVAHVILTGESSSINKVENDYKETLNKLQEALEKSNAPTCGTKSNFGKKIDGKKEKQQRLDPPNSKEVRFLFSGHAYTLKAIHENEKYIYKTKIDLINPWGKKKSEEPKIKDRTIYNNNEYNHYENAVGKDEITVSLDEFIEYFRNIYY